MTNMLPENKRERSLARLTVHVLARLVLMRRIHIY